MTTKQYGGIFGRNPTFNNVTVDGTLTVDQIAEKTGAAGITLDGVTLKDGNVVLANGKGIDFSATPGTGASKLFDDYEEGTWSPVAADAVSGGNLATPSIAAGFYRKIGDMVFLHGYLGNISVSGMTAGNVFYIRNLPYAPSSAAGEVSFYAGSLWCQTITFADVLVPIIISSTNYITLENVRSTLNDASALVSNLNASGTSDLTFTIAYPTA